MSVGAFEENSFIALIRRSNAKDYYFPQWKYDIKKYGQKVSMKEEFIRFVL